MNKLRPKLDRAFSAKVYPDTKTPLNTVLLAAARADFEIHYLGQTFPWVLGGKMLPDSKCFFVTRAPFDRDLQVGRFPQFRREDIPDLDQLLRDTRNAGLEFSRSVNWKQRITLLRTIAEVVQERFWLLCVAKMYETGQSLAEAIGETDEEVDFLLAAAMYLEELHNDELLASPTWSGDFNGKRYVPHGVFLNIAPFNFPGAIPMDMAAKALAMGNAVIEKSSDKSALCGYLVYESIVKAFERCGISPDGVVNYCPGGPDVVDMLLASEDIAGISFTGSSAALDQIRSKHGTMLRNRYHGKAPLTFGSTETSGVNIAIVWSDADPVYAAQECAKSFIGRQGQKCSSGRVLMVHSAIKAEFDAALIAAVEKVRFGNVLHGADVGPVITAAAEDVIFQGVVDLAVATDGKVHTKRENRDFELGKLSHRVLPMIIFADKECVRDEAKAKTLMNTEIFGPVSTVIEVADLRTVKKLCGMSEFALTGTSFTSDLLLFLDVIPAGNLYCNRKCTGALVESECFGGLSSRSSPSGIKGKNALALFGSQQTISGFYRREMSLQERSHYIGEMEERYGVIFSKH